MVRRTFSFIMTAKCISLCSTHLTLIVLRYVSVGAYVICSLILLALGGYSTAIGTPLGNSQGKIESKGYKRSSNFN